MKTISKFLLEHNPRTMDPNFRRKVMDFFRNNKYPDDSKVHAFAQQLGVDPSIIEQEAYSIISDFLCYGCYVDQAGDVDQAQLKAGIEVEKEHTDCPLIAQKIAIDHLCEIPDYYTRLKKMEDEAKSEGIMKEPTEENTLNEFGNSAAGLATSGSYESLPTKTATVRPTFSKIKDEEKEKVQEGAKKYVAEVLKKVKGGYVIAKHNGPNKGERLPQTKKPVSKQKAKSIMSAIHFSKHGKGK